MHLSHFLSTPPAFGRAVPVVPGVLWLRMPLPFALDHINLWLIEDGDGWAIVDTGIGDARTQALWQGVIAETIGERKVTRLISTHYHPDHMGLSEWLRNRFDVPFEATLAEWLIGRMLSLDTGPSVLEASVRFYRAAGAADSLLDSVVRRGNLYASLVDGIPASFARLVEGQDLEIGGHRWRVLIGRGHSPEMACLLCEEMGLLISGDQILPSISPNISVWPSEPEADPLSLFLDSQKAFKAISDDVLVLPSHGLPFCGLHRRIDEVIHHHEERLAATLSATGAGVTATGLLEVLFSRELDNHQIYFALGESLAHLNYLRGRGEVERETDTLGVHRYRRR